MHAVATDPGTVDRPCMYIQIDQGSEDEGYGAEGSDEEEAPSAPLPELRLVPVNADMLDAMFKAFCEGAERNPDFGAEEEGQGNLFFDQGEVLAGAFDPDLDEGNDVEDLVGGDPDRFGDPEEEGDDGFEEFEDGEQNGGKDAQ